jgi:response regulator NasT
VQLRFKEPHRQKAILIDAQDNREQFLSSLLLDRGIVVVARFASLAEAASLHQMPDCDLVVTYLHTISATEFERVQIVAAKFNRPILAMSEDDDPQRIACLVEAGVDHVLCIGTSSDRLRSAVGQTLAIHERTQALRARLTRAEQRLEERKLIERAKSILIQQRAISEPDAMRELQTKSMKRNEPIAQVARTIIAAKELLG